MAKQQQEMPKIGFKSTHLLTTQNLGIGSYGSVCKAVCDDLLCAAKIIHPTLFDPNAIQQIEREREHRLPIHRFMQECEFMSSIRHPNIVQFLGTHQDPKTGLPVLLMEFMDKSLTDFLESSQDLLPYHIQIKFCHDITLAISYLHSNGITHRDLSSNNVLLCGNVIAKVTDFGMAKLADINPQGTRVSFTMCPGTNAYMPPEAVKDPPVYTEKIDCFSIGVLIIQILTRCFPKPGDRHKMVHTTDPRFPKIEVRATETERRQNHIGLVDPNHPLLQIALDCLKESDVERPPAQKLCHRVAALKETPWFTDRERVGNKTEREEELDKKVQDNDYIIQQRDEENCQMGQGYIQQISSLQEIIRSQNNCLQKKDDIIREKNDVIQEKNDIIQDNEQTICASRQECQQLRGIIKEQQRQLQNITKELESSEQVMAQFQKRIQELDQQLMKQPSIEVLDKPQPSLKDPPQTHHSDTSSRTVTRDSFTLKWRKGKKAPREIYRESDAIINGEIVYFRVAYKDIYIYNSRNETWEQLPDCVYSYSSLVVISNTITAVGGRDSGNKVTNQLLSLTEESKLKRWTEVFPSMHTKTDSSIAACTGHAVIVAGGRDENWETIKTVQIMNIDTKQWSSAADLPEPLSGASVTICRECVYILGGWSGPYTPTKSVHTCTLADLFLSFQSGLQGESLARSLSLTCPGRSTIWSKVVDLPVTNSTCVTLHNRMLAIGGRDFEGSPTCDVHQYHPTSDTWELISHMNACRRQCFAAVLPSNELLVVGGYTSSSWKSETDSVEILSIHSIHTSTVV